MSLARPNSQRILFDGENISFDASLVTYTCYINSTNIPPIMIINRIYETQNLVSLKLVSFLVGLRTYQYAWVSQEVSFLQVSPPTTCIRLSSPHTCYMPHPSHSSRFYHPNNIGWAIWIIKLLICSLRHSPVSSSLLGPNILLNTLFSHILDLRSSLKLSDQVSHPYKTTGWIIVCYTLLVVFSTAP